MEVPEGTNGYKWRVKKILYKLKQSCRLWKNKINKELINIGFKKLKREPCMYVKFNRNNEIICLLTVYVNDILITGKENEINLTKRLLKQRFNVNDIGPVHTNIDINFEKTTNEYILHQQRHLENLLSKFNIDNYKPSQNMTPDEYPALKR